MKKLFAISTILAAAVSSTYAQAPSGGPYSIEKSVIGGGGGTSTGGNYGITGTAGQSAAGNGQLAQGYGHQPGFWSRDQLPTAANVSVSGRVSTANGAGIRNVLIRLTSSSGFVRTVLTSTFGYYRFDDVEPGSSYLISVLSKRYGFNEPIRIINVSGDLTNIDFSALD